MKFSIQEFENLRMGFSAIGQGNHSNMVLFDASHHVDAVTDDSKLPWHKYLKGQ
jgi:hypothetical protein